jgi:hypothetical protein
MSAVDEYHRSSFVVTFSPDAHERDVAEVLEAVKALKVVTDAAVDELETKLVDCAKTCGGLEYMLDQAEATTAKLRRFHDQVMHHWTWVPVDPRRRRHILKALLDAIEDAHDEMGR